MRTLLLFPALLTLLNPTSAEEMDGASFVEEFAKLDREHWYLSDGWTNGDHQNCGWSSEEVTVRDDRLFVGFSRNPAADRQYRCGEIQTRARYGYGTYEARIRTPEGSGLNANIFTYIGEVHGVPHDEIDFEFLLRDTSQVQLNVFRDGDGGNERMVDLPVPSDDGFTDYAFVWEPGRVSWFIDGREVHRVEDAEIVPVNNAKIYLSLWGTDTLTNWMGAFEPPEGPIAMEVERVAFTRLGEDCQFLGGWEAQTSDSLN